jgi:hypothetical protein
MAQAEHVFNAVGALITGANAKPFTNSAGAAQAHFVGAMAGNPPWLIPLFVDSNAFEDRADHLNTVVAWNMAGRIA